MDYMAFGFTILGVIIAAFILQHFGYLSHTSPLKMSAGGKPGTRGVSGYHLSTPAQRTETLVKRFEI